MTTSLSEAVFRLERLQDNVEVRSQLIDKASKVFADIKGMSKLLTTVSELLAKN